MNEAQKKEYVANNGEICPFCGDRYCVAPVSYENPKFPDNGQLSIDVSCSSCKEKWGEVYSLTDTYL